MKRHFGKQLSGTIGELHARRSSVRMFVPNYRLGEVLNSSDARVSLSEEVLIPKRYRECRTKFGGCFGRREKIRQNSINSVTLQYQVNTQASLPMALRGHGVPPKSTMV